MQRPSKHPERGVLGVLFWGQGASQQRGRHVCGGLRLLPSGLRCFPTLPNQCFATGRVSQEGVRLSAPGASMVVSDIREPLLGSDMAALAKQSHRFFPCHECSLQLFSAGWHDLAVRQHEHQLRTYPHSWRSSRGQAAKWHSQTC